MAEGNIVDNIRSDPREVAVSVASGTWFSYHKRGGGITKQHGRIMHVRYHISGRSTSQVKRQAEVIYP